MKLYIIRIVATDRHENKVDGFLSTEYKSTEHELILEQITRKSLDNTAQAVSKLVTMIKLDIAQSLCKSLNSKVQRFYPGADVELTVCSRDFTDSQMVDLVTRNKQQTGDDVPQDADFSW